MALKEASAPQFKVYIQQVKANALTLANSLIKLGYKIVTDGTDNHLVLWDARPTGLSGSKLEKILEKCEISVNKNSIFGDTSAINPGGIRLGTPAMTTRGMVESDMEAIASLLHRVTMLGQRIQQEGLQRKKVDVDSAAVSGVGAGSDSLKVSAPVMKLTEFVGALSAEEYAGDLSAIRCDVEKLSTSFPLPGLKP